MKLNYKITTYFLIAVVAALVVTVGVLASSESGTDSVADLNTGNDQMYTLADIYERLDNGTAGTKQAFQEPGAGPSTGTMYTLNDIMGKAPAVDDTDGAGVADVASGKTFWGLTSGEWGLQTGTASGGGGVGLPKTGQTTSYATGDDGDLEKGVDWPSPRFTDNSNGTVTDNLTGLIWLKNANCAGGPASWANALSYSNALYDGCTNCFGGSTDCGLSDGSTAGDWRLPNVRELHSLIDYGQDNPALPSSHPFTGVQSAYYWSSTTDSDFTIYALYVTLDNGRVISGNKPNTNFVWPVRGGQ